VSFDLNLDVFDELKVIIRGHLLKVHGELSKYQLRVLVINLDEIFKLRLNEVLNLGNVLQNLLHLNLRNNGVMVEKIELLGNFSKVNGFPRRKFLVLQRILSQFLSDSEKNFFLRFLQCV
jgi:hypothetical protein